MNAVTLLENTRDQWSAVGAPVRAAGWSGPSPGRVTVVVAVSAFKGTVALEAALTEIPGEADWFAVPLDAPPGAPSGALGFPRSPAEPAGTATIGVTVKVNALWLRARMDRAPEDRALFDRHPAAFGSVDRVIAA